MTERQHPLEVIRLSRDWSFQELADEIEARTGHRRNQDCWRKICRGQTDRANDRTSNILRLFFAALKADRHATGERRKAAV